jgi:hypothetical protein
MDMNKILATLLASTFLAYSADKKAEPEKKDDKAKTAVATDKGANTPAPHSPYRPPRRGAPGGRVDGGSRAAGDDLPALYVIAPDHSGLTTKAQPSLFWFQSKATPVKMLLTLSATNRISPIVETNVDGNVDERLRRIDLSRYNVRLDEGMEYEWSVATARNGETGSSDIVASGRIARIKPTDTLTEKLAGAAEGQKSGVYAAEGLWYDAIEALFSQIKAHPDDPELSKQRDAYFQDVGLTTVVTTLSAK